MSNPFHSGYKTEMQQRAAGKGLLCPYCLQSNDEIECLGCSPDGFNLNCQYKCSVCENEWEGD